MVGVQGRAWSTSLYRSQLVCIHGAGLWDEDLLKIALQGAAFKKKKIKKNQGTEDFRHTSSYCMDTAPGKACLFA